MFSWKRWVVTLLYFLAKRKQVHFISIEGTLQSCHLKRKKTENVSETQKIWEPLKLPVCKSQFCSLQWAEQGMLLLPDPKSSAAPAGLVPGSARLPKEKNPRNTVLRAPAHQQELNWLWDNSETLSDTITSPYLWTFSCLEYEEPCKHEQCTSSPKKPQSNLETNNLLPEICYLDKSIPGRFWNKTTESVLHQCDPFPLSVPPWGQLKLMLLTGLFDDSWSVARYLCTESVWRTWELPAELKRANTKSCNLLPKLKDHQWFGDSFVWAGFPEALQEGAARGSHQNLTSLPQLQCWAVQDTPWA